jgi:hypothetical protein
MEHGKRTRRSQNTVTRVEQSRESYTAIAEVLGGGKKDCLSL